MKIDLSIMDNADDELDPVDRPRTKRVKHSGTYMPRQRLVKLIYADASIHKRSPLHHSGPTSSTRRKSSGRPDEEEGLCIYLTRQCSLPHIAERVERALEDGKNSR